jgi:hypothetical protein
VLRKIGYALGATAAAAAIAMGGFTVAGAATTACGKACFDVGFVNPGSGSAILASTSGRDTTGNLVRLLAGSNGLPSEDFAKIQVGTIVPTYCTAAGQAATGSLFTSQQCQLLVTEGYAKNQTYELAFNPNNGGLEDECIGAASARSGSQVKLEPCGASAGTVLIPIRKLPGGRVSQRGVVWVVNGASANLSNPNVLTSNGAYPSNPTWSQVAFNGRLGIDTQEVCSANGPYRVPVCTGPVKVVDGLAHR